MKNGLISKEFSFFSHISRKLSFKRFDRFEEISILKKANANFIEPGGLEEILNSGFLILLLFPCRKVRFREINFPEFLEVIRILDFLMIKGKLWSFAFEENIESCFLKIPRTEDEMQAKSKACKDRTR
jgi:hypothetical protein